MAAMNVWKNLVRNVSFLLCLFPVFTVHAAGKPASYRWGTLHIGGGGYVTGIAIHPSDRNIMYIRTDVGGAYRWDKEGMQWQQMLNWVGPDNANLIGVDGVALDPGNTDRVYLALGRRLEGEGGVYRSEDQGKTWIKLMPAAYEGNGRAARWFGECIAVDPRNSAVIYAGTRRNGLWRSTDDGKTWEKVPDIPEGYTGNQPMGVRTIVFDPSVKSGKCSSVIYVGIPGTGIFSSTNGGKSFALMAGSPLNPNRAQVVKGELYVSHGRGVALFSGGTWTDISPVKGKNYVGLAVDADDNRKIVAAQRYRSFYNSIYRSEDQGLTWEQIHTEAAPANLHTDVPWWPKTRYSSATAGMAFAPGSRGSLYYTDWFGIWYTPDVWAGTTDWYTLEKGHEETVVLTMVSPPDGALVYSGVADVSGFKHVGTDAYPEKRLCPYSECFSIAVCESKPANLAVVGAKSWGGQQTGLSTSSDFGETWNPRTLPEGCSLGMIAVSSAEPAKMVYVSGAGKAYYTHDAGGSWEACRGIPENIIALKDIWKRDDVLVSDMTDGSFFILKDSVLYHSKDGAEWKSKRKMPVLAGPDAEKNMTAAPGLTGQLWFCLDSAGLWKTSDAGDTYQQVKGFQVARQVSCGAPEPGFPYPAVYCYGMRDGKWGLYRSVDSGAHWLRVNDDEHQFPGGVKAIAADRKIFGRIYIGSGGCGVYYGEPDSSKE